MLDPSVQQFLHTLSFLLIPGLFAITLHEVSHGWAAKRLGDPTAYMLGRLTINPFKHVDPIGTVVVPLALYFLAGLPFGWAKPVPVSFRHLRHPRRDMVLVAAAGPAANFVMALGWAVIAGLVDTFAGRDEVFLRWVVDNCSAGIVLNVGLGTFNLLPLPPLDGGRVLSGLLPPNASRILDRIEPFGFIILILLLVAPGQPLVRVLEPSFNYLVRFYSHIAGLA